MLPPSSPLRVPSWSATRTLVQTRSYAISIKSPVVYPKKPEHRIYNERKTFLYHQYRRLLESGSSHPLIFLEHKNIKPQRFVVLRRDIAAAAARHAPSLANPSPSPMPATPPEMPTLTVMRTSIFGVALRDHMGLESEITKDLTGLLHNAIVAITLPSLNPPQLKAIIHAMERSIPPVKPPTPEELANIKKAAEADPDTPGRRQKRQRPIKTPELKLAGALIEGKLFTAPGVQDVSKLPTLDTLRAQIVGLLSSPSMQLAAVLNEASGGKLARTLEGLKKSLEGSQEIAPLS